MNINISLHIYTGPEKYREHGNSVPRKADIWQEGRSLCQEKTSKIDDILTTEGKTLKIIQLKFNLYLQQLSLLQLIGNTNTLQVKYCQEDTVFAPRSQEAKLLFRPCLWTCSLISYVGIEDRYQHEQLFFIHSEDNNTNVISFWGVRSA